jgi:hypothetical protein
MTRFVALGSVMVDHAVNLSLLFSEQLGWILTSQENSDLVVAIDGRKSFPSFHLATQKPLL